MSEMSPLARLQNRRDELTAELRRVRAAIAELPDAKKPARTCSLLREFATLAPEFNAREALRFLVSRGWIPDLRENPLNSVRSSMAHLAKLGEIERVRCGVYRARGGST